ncbi:MAG: DUF5069 domain-containing protein [Thermoleophilia bacterium]
MTRQTDEPGGRVKDLSREDPRPMDAVLDGYPWLPRMIDKARASRAATLGPYYRYPCPIDRDCLDRLGLSADAFAEVAVDGRNDAEVLERISRLVPDLSRLASFEPLRLNASLHRDGS